MPASPAGHPAAPEPVRHCEVNNGSDLIEALLHKLDPHLSFRPVRASRGKLIRAEPVAMLYEKNLVSHIGELTALEDELTSYNGNINAKSPDRMDALVWSITELMTPASRCVLA
jgi:phage terminase large subunit-like protein